MQHGGDRPRRRRRAFHRLASRVDVGLRQIDLPGEAAHVLRDLRVEGGLNLDLLVVDRLLLVHLGEEGLEHLGDVAVALVHGGQYLTRHRRSFGGRRRRAWKRSNPATDFG